MSEELAIRGGPKLRAAPMPKRLAFGPEERRLVVEAMDHYQGVQYDFGYEGLYERRYCEAFATMQGGGYADAVATGTGAIYIALAALDLPERSEVILSPITDPGTVSAIILRGHVPVLADAAEQSYNLDPARIEERITGRTGAILVVHCTGEPVDMDAVMEIARGRNLKVLEDCSQAHGAKWRNERVGTFGHVAGFSTMYRKGHITGSSGGVVYARDVEMYHQLLAHADRGKARWRADFNDRDPSAMLFPALNWHTDEISCAIGIASIQRLDATNRRRLAFVEALAARLDAGSICRLQSRSAGYSPFILPVYVDTRRLNCSVLDFAQALQAEGIDLNPHYAYLIRDWPWATRHLNDDRDTEVARRARDTSFCLYLNENYGTKEAEDVVGAIEKLEYHLGR